MIQEATQGDDPLAPSPSLLKATNRSLRHGMASEKAGFVAHIVKNYGVGIEALDGALVGAVSTEHGRRGLASIQRAVQQALAPLIMQPSRRQAERNQRTEQEIAHEIDTFKADPKNEYFEDVRNLMADVMEVSTRNGYELSVADAYERACLLHPEVRKIIVGSKTGPRPSP